MDDPWQLQLFGGPSVHQDGQTVSRFQTQKVALLLAFLGYYPHRPHPRERLIDMLWPDATLDKGRNRLGQALCSLRHQMEPPGLALGSVLIADRLHIRLNPRAVVTDVSEFEGALQSAARSGETGERIAHLTRAAELYQGDLLPAFYEPWVIEERDRLHQRFLEATGQLTRALARRGDLGAALDHAQRLVIQDPFREPDRLHLVRLYMAAGDPAAGLRLCEEWEQVLREELHETPSAEFRALKARLKAKPGGDAPGAGAEARPRPVSGRNSALGVSCSPRPAPPSRVPLRFTRFFGRGEEIGALTRLLADVDVRLITLTGPGGVGKTRLAIEAVAPLKGRAAGGVWFAPLADLRDAGAIPAAVRDALHLPRLAGADPLEQVIAALAGVRAVLVLDNFEHLLDGGPAVVAALLGRAPSLTCLATSRRRLGVPGESVFPVPAFPLPSLGPSPDGPVSLSDLSAFAAVQLFVDRARFVRPDFQLTPRKASDLVRLLHILEGVPLAIELAAARVRALTLADIAGRLAESSDLLAARRPLIEARHLSLRVTLEWSYDLLPHPLQRFLAALSVFRGGWDQEAAEAVCGGALGGALSVPCALEELTSYSLLGVGRAAADTRMPETVREFAAGLLGPAEREALRRRHAAYFLAWAEGAAPRLQGPEQPAWLVRLEGAHDNLRAALEWGAEQPASDETGLRLAGAVFWFWHLRSHLDEGRVRLEALLARPGPQAGRTRAAALQGAGQLAYYQHDFARARALLEEGVALRRALGDARGVAYGLVYAGSAAKQQGDWPAARALLAESVALAREAGDPWVLGMALWMEAARHRTEGDDGAALPLLVESEALLRATGDPWALAAPVHYLGAILLAREDYAGAHAREEEVLALTRATGDQWRLAGCFDALGEIALLEGEADRARAAFTESLTLARAARVPERIGHELRNLGHVARLRGDRVEAHARYRESLTLSHQRGDRRSVAHTLEAFACLAAGNGKAAHAARLFAAADALGREVPGLLPLVQRRDHDRHVAAARAALGEAAFATAWAEGQALTLEAAVTEALGVVRKTRPRSPR